MHIGFESLQSGSNNETEETFRDENRYISKTLGIVADLRGYVQERSEWRQVETRDAKREQLVPRSPFNYSKCAKIGSKRAESGPKCAKSGPKRATSGLNAIPAAQNALRAVLSGATRSQIAHYGKPRSLQRVLVRLARN